MSNRVGVLDKGYIELLDYCASDIAVVNSARVSYLKESELMDERDEGLIRYLLKNRHGSPFEHGYFRFRVKAPLFVFREWHRHRAGHSYNEWSARYSKMAPEFYIPLEGTVLTQVGKPGHYQYEQLDEESATQYRIWLEDFTKLSYSLYEQALEQGVALQQARLFLPVCTYSEMYWSCNPRSLMHFLGLRNSPGAQAEIREYAQAAEAFFQDVMPVTAREFIDGGRITP